MAKYTFVADHSYNLDTHVVTHTFNSEHISDVIANFEQFLRGAGYHFDGNIEIVDDSPKVSCGYQPNAHYFDTERNR